MGPQGSHSVDYVPSDTSRLSAGLILICTLSAKKSMTEGMASLRKDGGKMHIQRMCSARVRRFVRSALKLSTGQFPRRASPTPTGRAFCFLPLGSGAVLNTRGPYSSKSPFLPSFQTDQNLSTPQNFILPQPS